MTLRELLEKLPREKPEKRNPGFRSVPGEKMFSAQAGENGLCEVYSSGYAVYDNGDRKTVVWVGDCGTIEYHFSKENVSVDLMDLPWYQAVVLTGEERIRRALEHPKMEEDEEELDRFSSVSFGNPEANYIRKETIEEMRRLLNILPEIHAEVYVLVKAYEYSQLEAAKMLGVSRQAVARRLSKARSEIDFILTRCREEGLPPYA